MKKAKSKLKAKKAKSSKIKPNNSLFPSIFPLGNRVLIRPFTKGEVENSKENTFGIILPDSDSKEKSEQGIILAVGSGKHEDGKIMPVEVSVGDKVLFSKYGYEDVTVHGEELYLIKEENILAILKN